MAGGNGDSARAHYNIDTYHAGINTRARRAFPRGGLRVGDPAPSFRLPLIDGGIADLEAMLADGHVVLAFGSFSAYPCVLQLPKIEALHQQFASQGVSILFVYGREIHPGEALPPHRSMDQKLEHARRLRAHTGISFAVCVDDLVGTTHRAYGDLPAMACVVHRDGRLIYRGEWLRAELLRQSLENLAARDAAWNAGQPGRLAYNESLTWIELEPAGERDRLLRLAGPKAVADFERSHIDHRPV